ncbi:MAG: CPBP family intramembrane metalloprotease, partial [Fimbriimonadales bacterium]|nr:CPBP family intramembrane metalloprotease [Fimbriimonadales bacterium]
GLQIVGIGVAVWLIIRRQPLGWRFALRLVLVLIVVGILAQLNEYPLWWLNYDPARPEPTFLGLVLLGILSSALLTGIMWFAFGLTAEWLNRAQPLGQMPIAKLATRRFWLTREALIALWVGLCFAGVHLAYLCAVYQVSFQLGAWSPLDVPYTNGVALPLPFLEPLLMGLLPAIQEELMFRGITLFLLWRVLKRFWLAALGSSVVWAFLHVGYPTEPAYLRGLELIPVGLAFCWLAARYGILAPMAAHYTYNALLAATTYLNMDSPVLRLSALATALGVALLFVPAAAVYLRMRRLPTLTEVEPPSMDMPPPPSTTETRVAPYRPLTRWDWALLLGLIALLIAVSVYDARTEESLLAHALQIDREQAVQRARAHLQQLGADLQGYRALPTFVEYEEEDIERYAREVGQEAAYQRYKEEDPTRHGYWEVRFFRPQERTQWYVYLTPDGELMDRYRVLPEEAAGSLPEERGKTKIMLTAAEARQRAEQYLTQTLNYDLSEWRLIETDRTERPNRYDYLFTYEHRTRVIGEARQRLSVQVQGLLAHNVSDWWEVPEQWYFAQRQARSWGVFAALWLIVLVIVLGAYVVFWEWREGNASSFSLPLAWRALLLGALCGGLILLSEGEYLIWEGYDPADPPALQVGIAALGSVLIVGLIGALTALLYMGLEPSYWRTRLGHLVPLSVWLKPSRWGEAPPDSPLRHPRAMREGFLVAVGLSLAMTVASYLHPSTLLSVDTPYPWAEVVGVSVWLALLGGGLALAAVGTYRRYLRSPWRVLLLALLFAPAAALGVDSWAQLRENLQDYALAWLIVLLSGFVLGRRLLQGNLLMWGLLLFWTLLATLGAPYLATAAPSLQLQGWIMMGVYALSVLAVGVFAWRRRVPEPVAVVAAAPEPTPLEGYAAVQMTDPRAETEQEA